MSAPQSPTFIHLRLHTEYSLIDGLTDVKALVKRCAKLGMPAVAITDHSNLFALVKFYKAAQGGGIKPIAGADVLVYNEAEPASPYLLSLYVQNETGYRTLTELISRAYRENQHQGVPQVMPEWLETTNQGLIALSGARQGQIGRAILAGNQDEARRVLAHWLGVFGDRFYLELQRTGRPHEEAYIEGAVELALEFDAPVVATNDVRFLDPTDFEAHEARVCIHQGRVLDDPRRPRDYTDQQYLKSPQEMAALFADLPEALENTVEIAKRCTLKLTLGKNYLPKFPVPEGMTPAEFFAEESRQGLRERLAVRAPTGKGTLEERTQAYWDRLELEIGVINQMDFPGYFLIVADFIQWAKNNGIPVGPGRGSGAGSLVAYALKITDLDPIEFDLLFERFLNPERVSMPDFDVDFCMDRRDEVIAYVADKYGRDQVSQIITYGSMAAKAVVRDVGRVLGHPYGFVDRIAKLIPFELGMTLEKALTDSEDLKKLYDTDEEVKALIDLAMSLEGLTRNAGKHAGGVVIAPSELIDFSPLYCEQGGDNLVTQFDKDDVEAVGLVKFDFLGLRTLTIIDWALEAINKTLAEQGKPPVDIAQIPLDDPPTYDLLKSCQTTAVFQLESRGMKDLIKRLRPDNFEDIVALVALFRPGPLQSGMVDDYINVKHGRQQAEYAHPILEPILKPTNGVILYQEQVMRIAQDMAGYTLGGADLLRRCLSGNTRVMDVASGRLVTLAEIAENPAGWLGREVFSLNLDTLKIEPRPITAIYPNGVREVFTLTTATGRSIRATADHLFYALDGWKPLALFAPGDTLALAANLPIQHGSEISDAQIKLVAYLLGDGHLSTKKPSNSYFCNSDPALIEDFNRCAEILFGSPAPVDHQLHPGRQTVTYARIGFISAFNRWVDGHVKRAHSRDKEIPDWVFTLSSSQLSLFIGTLWSTDGSFDTLIGHSDYTSTSETLIRQLQHLLLRLGITALFNIKTITYKNNPHLSYRVQITGREDMLKFQTRVGTYLSAAKRRMAEVCYAKIAGKGYNQSKHQLPPAIVPVIAEAKRVSGMTWAEIDAAVGSRRGGMSSGLNFQQPPTRSLSRQRVRRFAEAFGDSKLHALADSEILWDRIISIEYSGKEEVFDLTIDHNHNFVADEFIAHNCMGKKKPEEMAQQRGTFVSGAEKNGVKTEVANFIFDLVDKFSGYGFNKTLAAGTNIYTTAGVKPIEECGAGDEVIAFNPDGSSSKTQVVALHDHGLVPLWEIIFDDGTIERCTLDHKWLTRHGQWPLWAIIQADEAVWGKPSFITAESKTKPAQIEHDGELFAINLAIDETEQEQRQLWQSYLSRPTPSISTNNCWQLDGNTVLRKPVRVTFLGWQQGYDLEVAHPEHNFLLASGLCCSNSHSAAYALVSYQTAWLKAHFPSAFMAAVLSSDMDKTDKVVVFIEECRQMKITLRPPDINRSEFRFTALPDGSIQYGLGAIKGVGENAITDLLDERRKHGRYADLHDLCKRIDLRKANRRVLEALIKGGALDAIDANRARFMAELPDALKAAEQHGAMEETGQDDLFGLSQPAIAVEKPRALVAAEPWGEAERLEHEKNTLGLYLTGHPISPYEGEIGQFVTDRLGPLSEKYDQSNLGGGGFGRRGNEVKVVVAGLIVELRAKQNKNGKRMGFATLDDRTGRLEVAVFSDAFEKYRDFLVKDTLLVVEGNLSFDDFAGQLRLSAERLMSIEQARAHFAKHLTIRWPEGHAAPMADVLREVLTPFRGGPCPIFIEYRGKGAEGRLLLGEAWRVRPGEELLERLGKSMGSERVKLIYQ